MVPGLSDGEKNFRICITVYTQYRRVADGQTDILPLHSPRYAYASRGKKAAGNCMRNVNKCPKMSYSATVKWKSDIDPESVSAIESPVTES